MVSGNLGVGTDSPTAAVHIIKINGEKPTLVLESQGSTVATQWEFKANPITGRLTFKVFNGTTKPFKFQHTAATNLLRVGIIDNNTVDKNGNLIVTGNCTERNGACAAYVFDEGYELRSLSTVKQFINSNGHLPNIPSADEMTKSGVNLAFMSGRLLEKVEELTLYTIEQEDTIAEMRQLLSMQSALINSQSDRLNRLEEAYK